jgi:hypothetical protein
MSDVREQLGHPRLVSSLSTAYRVERTVIGGRAHSKPREPGDGLLALRRTIETRVIPSLVVAHARPSATETGLTAEPGDPATNEIAALAEQMLAADTDGAALRIDMLRDQGHALEDIYLCLFAPAAGYLHRLWSHDLCGFAEATLALWRLQQLLRNYSIEFRAEGERQETGRRALLAPTPREKHQLSYAMFCLVLMSEFFRRDGWEPWIEPEPTSREFGESIRNQWFDVVEFLVGGDKHLDELASRIRMIRRESPNRSIGVMVHGQVFIEHPELVSLVGADLTATDAKQGPIQAQNLVGLARHP